MINDFIISEEYVKSDVDNEAIKKASPLGNNHTDWKKPCLSNFKTNLREYLRPCQNNCCAYCRMRLHANEATPEIDHIIPKKLKPEWMYEPFNLCLSCKLCNTKKGHKKKTLVDNDITELPKNSESYLFVHPHIDKYSEHIELVGGILYRGITEKGRYTIELCNLDRYELAAERAAELIRHGQSFYEELFLVLVDRDHVQLIDQEDKFLKQIKEAIEEYCKNMPNDKI